MKYTVGVILCLCNSIKVFLLFMFITLINDNVIGLKYVLEYNQEESDGMTHVNSGVMVFKKKMRSIVSAGW